MLLKKILFIYQLLYNYLFFLLIIQNPYLLYYVDIPNILSASSNTKYVTLCKFVVYVSKKSINLPGVATTISGSRANAISYGLLSAPP